MTKRSSELRRYMRQVRAGEKRARKSGDWGQWKCIRRDEPEFERGGFHMFRGWARQIDRAYRIGNPPWMAVLVRPVGEFEHAILCHIENAELCWREKQKIKNEVFGADRFAVEVFPTEARKVDDCNIYHLWIYPEGYQPPFGLHPEDEAA